MGTCLLCGSNSLVNRQDSASRTIYNCPRCGVFVVSDVAERDASNKAAEAAAYLMRRKLSNAKDTVLISYEKSNLDKDYLQITAAQIADLFPKSFAEQMDGALLNLGLMSPFPGGEISVDDMKMAPLFYVRGENIEELMFVLRSLLQDGLIEAKDYGILNFPCAVTVTARGWERIEKLKKNESARKTLFICPPKPGSDIAEQYGKASAKLAKSCGFHLVSNFTERQEAKVTDELIAGVKSAFAVVCDLTESLGEAYYAAGLAAGLGKICLFTCQESAAKKLRVDNSQHPVILWENQEGLYISLQNAIRARM